MPADSILAAARKAQAALLLERFAAVPDPDWYEALLAAALDANGGNLTAAIAAADAAIAAMPTPPPDDDSGTPGDAALSTTLVPAAALSQMPQLPPVFNLHLPEGMVKINQTIVPAPVPEQPVRVTVESPPPGPTYSELVRDKTGNPIGSVTRPLKDSDGGAALSVPSSAPTPPVDADAEARSAGKLMADLAFDR